MTFLINSWAHIFGTQPYATSNTSRDCWWLAFLTNGEGYHNFHHKFQADYRNGVLWFQWDPTKWLIWALSSFGFTEQLNKVPQEVILKARLEAAMSQAELRLKPLSGEARAAFEETLVLQRSKLNEIMAGWAQARVHYVKLRISAHHDSNEKLLHYKAVLRKHRADLRKAKVEWRETLRTHSRQWGYQTI
jgi:stearoyl-CoA desaturase (delta-9 desaturase)